MNDWQDELAPTSECIDILRFDAPLSADEQTHLESCPRCQSEIALFREFQSDVTTPEEASEVRAIAADVQQRLGNVEPFRPRRTRTWAVAAAALAAILGASTWMQMREPSIDVPAETAIYRSARLEGLQPATGDVTEAPNELRWEPVPDATRYQVQLLEVDASPVWNASTRGTSIALPPAARAQFAPGKTLLWDVRAFRGEEMLAASETQSVRVSVTPLRSDS